MSDSPQLDLLGLDLQGLTALAESGGQPAYRGRQLYEAIYRQRIGALSAISTLPQTYRNKLVQENRTIGMPEIDKRFVSVDGTVRYLVRFTDGQTVETVWMPEGDGGEAGDGSDAGDEEQGTRKFDRATICVSSQVGCAVNCQFCMTALLGVQRNLSAGEIVGQILTLLNDHQVDLERERINLVFMGQGEPFLNYDNFMKAVRLLVEAVGIPESRMTVSTSGIVPMMDRLRDDCPVALAVSLHAPNDELRDRIMPINRKYPLAELLAACRRYLERAPRDFVTFEYVMLAGVNDSLGHARELAELVAETPCKLNLIPFNPFPQSGLERSDRDTIRRFGDFLNGAGIVTTVRKTRGDDIDAACGQLAGEVQDRTRRTLRIARAAP